MHALRRFDLALLVTAGLVLAGCGKDDPKSGPAAAAHDHDHDAPHKGEVLELGKDGEAHLEMMHDHDGGNLGVYVYGKDFKSPVSVAKPVVTIQTKAGGTTTMDLVAVDAKPDGTAHHWKGQHDELKTDPWLGRIDLVIDGKPHRSALEGPAHDHK